LLKLNFARNSQFVVLTGCKDQSTIFKATYFLGEELASDRADAWKQFDTIKQTNSYTVFPVASRVDSFIGVEAELFNHLCV